MHRKSSISIREWLENSNKALLVTGIRRCGKSILLKQIMDEMKEDQGVTDDHYIYEPGRYEIRIYKECDGFVWVCGETYR